MHTCCLAGRPVYSTGYSGNLAAEIQIEKRKNMVANSISMLNQIVMIKVLLKIIIGEQVANSPRDCQVLFFHTFIYSV